MPSHQPNEKNFTSFKLAAAMQKHAIKSLTYCPAGVAEVCNFHLKFIQRQNALPFIYNAAICNSINPSRFSNKEQPQVDINRREASTSVTLPRYFIY